MSNSDKRLFSSIVIVICAFLLVYFSATNNQNFPISLTIIIVAAIAGGLLYLFNKVLFKDFEINRQISERMTENDYLNQISEDIRTLKIMVIIFAAVAIVTMLISVFSLLSLASVFSKF